MFLANKLNKGGSLGGYQISRSLRFNSADSAYLTRTPATATNQKTWTWSAWVKRSTLDVNQVIFAAGTSNSLRTYINFLPGDALVISSEITAGVVLELTTTQVFRDVSAWYNITIAVDTTQATNTNRAKIYVNGTQVTSFSAATYPSQNTDLLGINSTDPHTIGVRGTYSLTTFLPAYLTEIYLIDGQALTPSSFGETNAQTGVWQPKAYSGSYGTNGFYLNFSDNSNTTAATLGKDYSGNGNNWTPNNFSVTAGAGNDSLVDSPTSYGVDTGVGGTVRGNYATLSPTYAGATGITNGNLDVTLSGGTQYGTMSLTTGKWYWEVTPTASLSGSYLGVMDSTFIKTDATWGTTTTSTYVNNGNQYGIGGTGAYGATYTTGDVIGFALDLDNGTMVFYKNGTSQGTASTGMTGREWRPMLYASGGTYACNFGQRPFVHAAPSGFKALCTQNLPTPAIGATAATQAGKFFNPVLYTGNSTANTSITGVGFQPDFVWLKCRNAISQYHNIVDSVRGATGSVMNTLYTNDTLVEATTNSANYTSYGLVKSLDSDGFTVTTGSINYDQVNKTGNTYVAWNWKANGSGSSNTAGSITSTVSANTTSGFSIVTYNGTGANATVGHGLGVAPSMIFIKSRSSATNWNSYHIAVGASATIILNSTSGAVSGSTFFNSTAPTSTVFSLGSDGSTNPSGAQQVAYCFAPVAGYSAFGSYTGNGSADGPFIYTGFKPAFVLIKRCDTTSGGYWRILDDTRNTSNVVDKELYPNDTSTEGTFAALDFTSNGVKIRNSDSQYNGSSALYLYACFAENPFKYSLAR
jgi:hypothetical protein